MSTTPSPPFQGTLMELYGGGRKKKNDSSSGSGSGEGGNDSNGRSVVVHGNGSPFHPPQPRRQQQQQQQQQQNQNGGGGRPSHHRHPPSSSSWASSSSAAQTTLRRDAGNNNNGYSNNNKNNNNNNPNNNKKHGPKSGGAANAAASAKSRKKIGSNYHFIPMVGRQPHRHKRGDSSSGSSSGGSSDGDDGRRHNDKNRLSGDVMHVNGFANNAQNAKRRSGASNSNDDDHDMLLSDQDALLRDIFTTTPDRGGMLSSSNNNRATTASSNESSNILRRSINDSSSVKGRGEGEVNGNKGRSKGAAGGRSREEDSSRTADTPPQRPSKAGGMVDDNKIQSEDDEGDYDDDGGDGPFTSALGRRIWRQYRNRIMQEEEEEEKEQQQRQRLIPANAGLLLPENNRTGQRHTQRKQRTTPPSSSFGRRTTPSPDFLRLPPTMVRIRRSSSSSPSPSSSSSSNDDKLVWVNAEELQRRVLQHHLDLEAALDDERQPVAAAARESPSSLSSRDERDVVVAAQQQQQRDDDDDGISSSLSSSLLTSECLTRVVERDDDPRVGLGMSLREHDGRVYIQALLGRDGSRLEEEEGDIGTTMTTTTATGGGGREGGGGRDYGGDNAGPAARAGLLPGDRLLGLNGRPFLRGRLASLWNADMNANDGSGGDHGLHSAQFSSEEVLKSVGDVISTAKSPMALHIQRESDRGPILALLRRLQTEYKEKSVTLSKVPAGQAARKARRASSQTSATIKFQQQKPTTTATRPKGPVVHPFARAMAERNLIKRGKDESVVTGQLRIFTDRSRQWESKLSFRLRASDYALRPLLDARDVEPSYYASFLAEDERLPPFFDYKFSKSLRSYAPSTPMIQDWRLSSSRPGPGLGEMTASPPRRASSRRQMSRESAIMADLYAGLDKDDADVQDMFLGGRGSASDGEGAAYPPSAGMQAMTDPSDIFVPLVGVRKALCVRILNSFLDNRNRTAFTIWCYDVESGREWYAPVRYYNDFKDLRSALMRVDKSIGDIPFPSLGWSLSFSSESKESAKTKEARRNQLESFLRRVFAGMYRGRLHPHLAEVAVHIQTFVGCDTILGENGSGLSLSKQVAISESSYGKRTPDPKSEPDNNARMLLKRSIMRYCYRLFLLPSVEQLVSQFIGAAMEKVSTGTMGSTTRQSRQLEVDKGEATKDVTKIRDFVDQVQELILEGCHDDFVSISERRDFAALADDLDHSIRDEVFREAVREQTELEVYVPLRSTISKYLVYAWLNEDMEMKFKMNALADKPQSYFRIPKEHRSRSDWKSVSRILREGVGRSTLPCVKLRAVVDAAKEISQLDSEERSVFPDATFFDGQVVTKTKTLGADDFLPIFIFCSVQAKIERPSALCELLSLMCDPKKMNGETGYYLASFHAALTHIHELDLTEAENDLSIIFDT